MLALLVFSVILWMTEGVSYPVSAAIIACLMTFLIGTAPHAETAGKFYTTSQGLTMALGGFANTAWALVGAALFLSAAMTKTGLDRRIALNILSLIGAKTNRVVMGVILVGFVLSFFVPSTTARVACIVPIVVGIITAFGVERSSRFAAVLMIATAQADSIWNVGIKTAAAQNMIAVNFIKQQLNYDISWLEWFTAAAPFAAIMSVALYFVLIKLMPPRSRKSPAGRRSSAKKWRPSENDRCGEETARDFHHPALLLDHRKGTPQHRYLFFHAGSHHAHDAAGRRRHDLAGGPE